MTASRWRAAPAILAACGAASGSACGGPNIAVPAYPQPEGAAPEVVGFMPPPAQIEHIAAAPPAPGCLWADGQWVWSAQHWDWRPGVWVRPPPGCRYSAPAFEWAPSEADRRGVLYYRPGRWYSALEPKVCSEPIVICLAPSPPGPGSPSLRPSSSSGASASQAASSGASSSQAASSAADSSAGSEASFRQ